ncbi:hypothetical protein BD779DRAFT_1785974 [Infundibulicybe gibba]|nr:hypothetical protein BD779DRAFT_1785974 [Infundibulicybe gibba]
MQHLNKFYNNSQFPCGAACFSPMVPTNLVQAWVAHGGSMSTEHDFRQTDCFFCNGSEDPWVDSKPAVLIPLLSDTLIRVLMQGFLARSLIVRDVRWIALSVHEQFFMPMAKYTLDAVPHGHSHSGANAQAQAEELMISSPSGNRKQQKRPRDQTTTSPSRRAPSDSRLRVEKPIRIQLQRYLGHDKIYAPDPNRSWSSRLERPHSYASKTTHSARGVVSATLPRSDRADRTHRRNPHAVFWENIRNAQPPTYGLLKVSAKALEGAPEADVVAFTPGTMYEGKKFREFQIPAGLLVVRADAGSFPSLGKAAGDAESRHARHPSNSPIKNV